MARARVLLSTRSRVEISAIVLRELSVTKIFMPASPVALP